MSYYVPFRDAETEFTEKRSRFIGHVWRVDDEDAARRRIDQTRKKYHDARHNCWCYLLRSGVVRYADDHGMAIVGVESGLPPAPLRP